MYLLIEGFLEGCVEEYFEVFFAAVVQVVSVGIMKAWTKTRQKFFLRFLIILERFTIFAANFRSL